MPDERTSFPILEDAATKAGLPWHQVAEDVAIAAKNLGGVVAAKDADDEFSLMRVAAENTDDAPSVDTLAVMPVKDNLGKIQYIPMNAQGKIPVSFDSGTEKKGFGSVLGVADTATEVCKITLTADKNYQNLDVLGSCNRNCLFEIIQKDDAAETVLADFLVGSGQYSFQLNMSNFKMLAGSTGTQELIIKGTQLQGPDTNMHSTVTIIELP